MDRDENLIRSIAPDVLRVLEREGFFEALDDQLCPEDIGRKAAVCDGGFSLSRGILAKNGHDTEAIDDIISVLAFMGGCCDCEILYNVAGESRLKSRYWKAEAGHRQGRTHEGDPSL